MDGCLSGDPAARAELVDRFHRVVRQAVSFKVIGRSPSVQPADVDDAVQQTFLTIFAHEGLVLRRWRGQATLKTYLCRIAERVAQRYFDRAARAAGRFRLLLDGSDGAAEDVVDRMAQEALVASLEPAEVALATAQERSRLREAILERLSDKGRVYYDYLFVQELDVATIAELEQTNPNNVYQWKNRIVLAASELLHAAGYRRTEKNR